MPNRFAPALFASALAWTATAAMAQPAPTALPQVTVEAVMPKMVHDQARAFTETYAAPTAQLGQIARWRDPVCVQVYGLIPDLAAKVKARVEDVSRAVGRGVDRAGCRGNIEIIFTGKPQTLMDGVARSRELLLGYFHRQDTRKLTAVTHPIQAWYVTATLGGAGNTTRTFLNTPCRQEVKCGLSPHPVGAM